MSETAATAATTLEPPRRSRLLDAVNVAVFMAALVTIAVAVNLLALEPSWRLQFDATRTRAYSLSDQTRRLLADLEGQWTVALIMGADGLDPAVVRQVEEVLKRYRQASPRIGVVRIDPSDPATLDEYDALLSKLATIYRDRIASWGDALAEGRETLQDFALFGQQQAGRLVELSAAVAADEAAQDDIQQLLGVIALRVEQASRVTEELDRAMRAGESRPWPDFETARSILVAALGGWANELFQIVQLFDQWRQDEATGLTVRRFAVEERPSYEQQAQQLAVTADPLKHLAPLELGRISRHLETGEAAIVMGPEGAAVVPSAQLFPTLNIRQHGSGEVAFDRRFRGEQAISAAIRSLRSGPMPKVVLVHAQDASLLSPAGQNIDFHGGQALLAASRFEVEEWIVHRTQRPAVDRDRGVVWIVLPPPVPARQSLAVNEAEQTLIRAAGELIDAGEPVLLNFSASALAKAGQRDPWPTLAAPLGLDVDTSRVIFERVLDQDDTAVNQRVIQASDYASDHPIASAGHGLRTSFDLPVAVRPAETAPPGIDLAVIAAVEPAASRWLEDEWMVDPDSLDEPTDDQRFDEHVPIVVAVERVHPIERKVQRLLVVGSGGWLLSYMADVVVSMGGDRMALVNPGNYELLMAAIAWLAGMDDVIAPSPVGRQVARLDGVTSQARTLWTLIALLGAPGACLVLGIGVWTVRRR